MSTEHAIPDLPLLVLHIGNLADAAEKGAAALRDLIPLLTELYRSVEARGEGEPDEPPSTVRTEPPREPSLAECRLDALIDVLGGALPTPEPLSDAEVAAMVQVFAPDDEPPAPDRTATQANLLAFLHDHPQVLVNYRRYWSILIQWAS